MSDHAHIIEKIAKLLQLAEGKGTTPAESATAAAQASRLMFKYGIEQAELQGANLSDEEKAERSQDIDDITEQLISEITGANSNGAGPQSEPPEPYILGQD